MKTSENQSFCILNLTGLFLIYKPNWNDLKIDVETTQLVCTLNQLTVFFYDRDINRKSINYVVC